ncbi:fungal specific transcription factor [Stagonosporopsis vannaccii]|nr:fungal specific transcription factor [Stagonosporopsis vannaccii]
MNRRLVIVVLFTLYLQPVAAAEQAMDLSFSVPPMEQFYTGLDGTLRCIECTLSCWECMCSLSQSSTSSSYNQAYSNESSFCDPSAHADNAATTDLSGVLEYVNGFDQPLMDDTVHSINTNATIVQPITVEAHVDDTYVPGFRQPISLTPSHCSRRHAPRKDGFACTVEGCNKTFDRNCELNRHVKIHLSRNERPHRCLACGEGFLYPKDLNRHQRKHVKQASAKITYYCHVEGCPNTEGFSRRDNLLRHQRRQHEGTASPPA